ncbi:MAG: biotin attachment protein [Flavobacteriia bacterium]|nr:MAG: biotin attachment protein [Flavobacteriia bacterium]
MNRKLLQSLIIISVLLNIYGCQLHDKSISRVRGKVKFETIAVTSKIPGRIARLYVTEGQRVKQGDTLAKIDAPEIGAKMTGAKGAVNAAYAQLKMAHDGATQDQILQLDESIKAAKAQLDFSKETLNRMSNMYEDTLITKQAYEEVKMKYQMAQAQVDGLMAKRNEVTKSARKEIIAQARGQLNMAKAAEQEAQIALNEQYIIAPADMSIETITLKKGELATPGYTLFNGYELHSVFFRFTINETNIYNYNVGQEIIVENPYTEESITTRIRSINQLARYADITSTTPDYQLTESIYELKCVPTQVSDEQVWYNNATVIIKQ